MPISRPEKIKRLKKAVKRRARDNQPLKLAPPVQRANPNRKKGKKRLA